MTIKSTSEYENTWLYYIIIVNLLRVSVTLCDHLQGGFFLNITKTTKPTYNYKIFSYKYVMHKYMLKYRLQIKSFALNLRGSEVFMYCVWYHHPNVVVVVVVVVVCL